MKQAVIDIGSNSMRLTLYEIKDGRFKILFREKNMAGLAGYVEKGVLTKDGIACACSGLEDFRETLASLQIDDAAVFATASLRNINNTEEALAAIREETGYQVEVISGEEEALLGYYGAMKELNIRSGAFIDIGGASTEAVTFQEGIPQDLVSFHIGSLSLYKACVKKILPGDSAQHQIDKKIREEVEKEEATFYRPRTPLVCVGGTGRAVMKIASRYFHLPKEQNWLTARQLEEIGDVLRSGKKEASDLILKYESDRIHTLIPGLLILQYMFHRFHAEEVIFSKYGVMEGYLCQKLLSDDTAIQRTEN